jgi:hypothetical protein
MLILEGHDHDQVLEDYFKPYIYLIVFLFIDLKKFQVVKLLKQGMLSLVKGVTGQYCLVTKKGE